VSGLGLEPPIQPRGIIRSAADAVVTQAHQPTLPRTYMWFSAHDAPDIIAALVSPRVLRARTLCVKNPTCLVPLTVVIPLYRPDGDPRKRDVARRFLLHPDRRTLSPLGLSLASSIRKAAKRENNAMEKEGSDDPSLSTHLLMEPPPERLDEPFTKSATSGAVPQLIQYTAPGQRPATELGTRDSEALARRAPREPLL
jgi:hypothetical protein